MGVYPTVRYFDVNTGAELGREALVYRSAWYEEYNDYAVRRYRLVVADEHVEVRETCYCCTCYGEYGEPGYGGTDAYCRNHGFAGERACEEHSQPGSPDGGGRMPLSVQAYRARFAGAGDSS